MHAKVNLLYIKDVSCGSFMFLYLVNCAKIILDELHIGHLGVVKMKELARSFVWWPNIDQQIEHLVKECVERQQIQIWHHYTPRNS